MRLGLQQRVQRLEKIAHVTFATDVAIIVPIDGGFVDSHGKRYKELEDVPATAKIVNNIPIPEELKGVMFIEGNR